MPHEPFWQNGSKFLLIDIVTKMDDYTCTLEDKYIRKARIDLNEVPSKRLTDVKVLREWIIKQKHLKYETSKSVKSLYDPFN